MRALWGVLDHRLWTLKDRHVDRSIERILQLRAARGWNLEQTARVFLIDLQTLMIWMRCLDEQRDRPLIQTPEPVNRYPDFVRHLVRQLKRLFPFTVPQRWPFSWWLAVAVDQVSRALVGFAVFSGTPSSGRIQRFLARVIRASRTTPRYVVTDRGKQFWCRSFKRWCKRRGIRPRYGAVGEPASIAIVERFVRSMKQTSPSWHGW